MTHHIDGTPPPATTDPAYESWSEIDVHVLQWIYGTVSDDILIRILETESTACEAWTRLKNHFQNNKGSRAAALEHAFTHLSLSSVPSLDDYCQRLKELAEQMTDVGSTVDDQRLVLQLVRGLTQEYDTVGEYINQTLPTFETARSMLQLETHRQSARPTSAPTSALVAPSDPNPDPPVWPAHNNNSPHPLRSGTSAAPNRRHNSIPYRRGGHHQGGHRSNHGRGTHRLYSSANQPTYPPSYPYWAPPPYWATTSPPYPYPTQPGCLPGPPQLALGLDLLLAPPLMKVGLA